MAKDKGEKFNPMEVEPAVMFTRFLTWIRKKNRDTPKKLYAYSGVTFVLFTLIAVLLDIFMPFGAWWNVIRTFVMLPLGLSMFIFLYGVSINNHLKLVMNNDPEKEWVPFRRRWSLATRRRGAAIVLAVGVVAMFSATNSPTFTLVSAGFLALILAMLAFVRRTRDENSFAELGLMDGRDIITNRRIKEAQDKREIQNLAKRIEKEKKAEKRINPLRMNKSKNLD